MLGTQGAQALGLGPASLASGLGEPLRLTFPVIVQPGEEIGCVQVRAKGDDLPSVFNTRSSVLRSGNQYRVEIRSAQQVNEPAIGLVVSVGCSSPISREYVLFLDPPVIPLTAEVDPASTAPAETSRRTTARPAPARTEPARVAQRRRESSDGTASTPTAPVRAPVARKPRPVAPLVQAPVDAAVAPVAAATPRPAPAPSTAPTTVQRQRDRLTVAPSEAGTSGPDAPSTSPSVPPIMTPPVTAPGAPATATSTPAPVVSAPAPPEATTPSAPAIAPVVEADDSALREAALRKQQAELQQQIKLMSDQIAALRVQTAGLVNRNQVLQETTTSSMLIWWLIALAVLAILVAGWMAWRYTQLRRSVEGSAWWTGNTAHAATASGETMMGGETRGGLVALDPGTRLSPKPVTQIDPRASVPAAQAASVSNVAASRPTVRNATPRYQSAIDTDFTVSDIEAAMATVRTVSPPRETPRADTLDDSDFAALGEPTQPSPFTEPPPAAPVRATQTHLDIPPLMASTRLPPALPASTPLPPMRAAAPTPPPDEDVAPLDFKLDIPGSYDPLATDSLKTTMIIDQEPAGVDFELPAAPSAFDFDMSSPVRPLDDSSGEADASTLPALHGASALGDLFSSLPTTSADTILALDERDGTPLSTTEVDRLTTTAIDGPDQDALLASPRYRLARFADLMNQVDEVSATDPLRAIALLRQYVLRDEQIPTLFWLKLFELYRTVDKRSVYDALGEHFSRRYNRPMIAWDQALADRAPQSPLSAMGSVDREIEALWGQEAGLELMRSLLCDRDKSDAIVFNAVLQRDLLDAAKVFPRDGATGSQTGNTASTT